MIQPADNVPQESLDVAEVHQHSRIIQPIPRQKHLDLPVMAMQVFAFGPDHGQLMGSGKARDNS
jgi:hypothetical protein